MKAIIQRHVVGSKGRKLVPKRFASQFRDSDFAAGECVLMALKSTFPGEVCSTP